MAGGGAEGELRAAGGGGGGGSPHSRGGASPTSPASPHSRTPSASMASGDVIAAALAEGMRKRQSTRMQNFAELAAPRVAAAAEWEGLSAEEEAPRLLPKPQTRPTP